MKSLMIRSAVLKNDQHCAKKLLRHTNARFSAGKWDLNSSNTIFQRKRVGHETHRLVSPNWRQVLSKLISRVQRHDWRLDICEKIEVV